MKRIAIILAALSMVFGLFSCAQEEYNHPSEDGVPSASSITPVITVNQEINQVTFSLPSGTKGYIPIWRFEDKNGDFTTYSAQDGLKKIYTTAGTYTVRMQLMNSNGVSPDYVDETFTIDNTIVNYDRYITMLAGGTSDSSKEWRINNSVAGHLACGESGTDGTNWWSASADEKESTGLYDNRVTFTSDYDYTFDPGSAGTLYVNTGVTASPYGSANPGDGNDYTYAVDAQTTTFSFNVDGDDLYLVLPAETEFPYIPNDSFISDPSIRIESITTKTLELVYDDGSIAWHYTFTSEAEAVTFNGFDYDNDANIWAPADDDHSFSFYYAPGWDPIDDPEVTQSGSTYTITLPTATYNQWQAQVYIIPTTDIALSSSINYDFSVILNSTKSHSATIKLTDSSSDGNYLFSEVVSLSAYEDYIFYQSDLAGIDASAVKLVFDFGGNPDGTEVTVDRITLKDHSIDDGTVLPSEEETDDDNTLYDITGETNLFRSCTYTLGYWYAPDWDPIDDPELTQDGWTYTWSLPYATTVQWQAQICFATDISTSSATTYDFCCDLYSTTSFTGVTIKLVDSSDEGVYYVTDRVTLSAYETYTYKIHDMPGIDIAAMDIYFDAGGNAEGTELTISNICFQEHQEKAALSYDDEGNLWKAADSDHSFSFFYAPNWGQIDDPEVTQSGSTYTITLPTATYDQWQAQVYIIPTTDIALSSANTYAFQCTLQCSADFSGTTIKLTDTTSDGNYLFTESGVSCAAYEDTTCKLTGLTGIDAAAVKLVFDFGGNPANFEVIISDIILEVE